MIKGAHEAVDETWFIGIVQLVQPFYDFISFRFGSTILVDGKLDAARSCSQQKPFVWHEHVKSVSLVVHVLPTRTK